MKISIIIPNYNKAKYLKQCIESCLNQTYENTQIIFVDNESKDNSLQIAKEIKQNSKKDFIIDVAKNVYPRCWDECIDKSREYLQGDYYTIVGSDDYLDKDNNIITSCWGIDKRGICCIKKIKTNEWNERLIILKENIQYWKDNNTNKTVEIIQLFYNQNNIL